MTDEELEELVPRWLRVLFAILRAAPMTEIKTASGILLLYCTAVWLPVTDLLGITVSESKLDAWFVFLSSVLGIASFAQGWKQSVTAKAAAAVITAPPPRAP